MSYHDYKYESEEEVTNKYIGNKNFQKIGIEYRSEKRYSSTEDISTLEFLDYSDNEWWNNQPEEEKKYYLTLHRNFISSLELEDLTELMVKLDEVIHEYGDDDTLSGLKKNMKSLVRVVHRHKYSREHQIPVNPETNQSRKSSTVW